MYLNDNINNYFSIGSIISGADAIKKFTPNLGIPYLGVQTPRWELGVKSWEPLVTPKSRLLNFLEIGVWNTKNFYSIQFLKLPNFLGFRSPELFIASTPDQLKSRLMTNHEAT